MHLPMICDRYELRDDVMPGAGRSRGGIGVVKAQRVLTDAFITHENERHFDVPWGIFGGDPGQVGKVDIYNVARPDDINHMPAKFSGMRVAAGDVHVFYAPCGGGYGDPLERPAAKVLDDVLDGFCTVEHARLAYGVVVDLVAETVDEAATKALRERMRGAPRAKAPTAATTALPRPAQAPASRSRETPAPSIQPSANGASPPDGRPTPAVAPPRPALPSVASGNGGSLSEALRGLRDAYGNAWSFEIIKHSTNGGTIEVVGQLRANGATVRETAVAVAAQSGSLGELLERTANDSLCKCVETLMRNGR
jgi:Hydantoinase B/oxoprolinase